MKIVLPKRELKLA